MKDVSQFVPTIEFPELEMRFGRENAITIVRTLEQFEGVCAELVANLSFEDRLRNVFCVMKENLHVQTQH